MNENVRKRNAVLAQTVIKGLESRNMTGYYAKNKEEALKQATEMSQWEKINSDFSRLMTKTTQRKKTRFTGWIG